MNETALAAHFRQAERCWPALTPDGRVDVILSLIKARWQAILVRVKRLLWIAQAAEDMRESNSALGLGELSTSHHQQASEDDSEDDRGVAPLANDGRWYPRLKVWKVGPSELDGAGLFAQCDLQPSEVILSEKPLFPPTTDRKSLRNLSIAQKDALVQIMADNSVDIAAIPNVATLDEGLDDWAAHTSHDAIAQLHLTFDQHARGFGSYIDEKLRLFRQVHILNHSCEPNAYGKWNEDTGRYVVRAIKPIAKEEEITVPYIDPYHECIKRWQLLGFECYCDICSMCGEQIDESDKELREVDDALDVLHTWRIRRFPGVKRYKVTPAIAKAIHDNDDLAEISSALKTIADYVVPHKEWAHQWAHPTFLIW